TYRIDPCGSELQQSPLANADKFGQRRNRRVGLDAAMMAAAATRTALAEHHMAELDRQKSSGIDRAVHPGAGDALADKDEQMRPGERIIFAAAAMKDGMRHHRI